MHPQTENTPPLILKALSGNHAGVEVALSNGEYTLGSGPDDDLQFVDVCLEQTHARIHVSGDTVLIAGAAGSITSDGGLVSDAGDDEWREVEPLEVLTIGTSTFAFGTVDANWAELVRSPGVEPGRGRNARPGRALIAIDNGMVKWGLATVGSLVTLTVVAWFTFALASSFGHTASSDRLDGMEAVRHALDQFPFGASIELRQEVDGEIFAKGFVNEAAERRALRAAVEETGVPVNFRLGVLSSIRVQLAAAIDSFGVPVTFELSETGSVRFAGEILSNEKADRFLAYIRDEVPGLTDVHSEIATAGTYYAEVTALAKRSGINDTVFLRLLDERIEATGVIVTDKIDAWVGFIQSYARRYADHLPLTSYVQLVNEKGSVVAETGPTRLGRSETAGDDTATELDLERLKQGSIAASDVFPTITDIKAAQTTQTDAKPTAAPDRGGVVSPQPPTVSHHDLAEAARDLVSGAVDAVAEGVPETAEGDDVADAVLRTWDGRGSTPSGAGVEPGPATAAPVRQQYPNLAHTTHRGAERCWAVLGVVWCVFPVVLFWLDYLSLSKTTSLKNFDMPNQYLLLEAALNPARTQQCAERLSRGRQVRFDKMSVFLEEARRNPGFIHYLVRDFTPPPVAVAGVMLRHQERYIQLQDGTKIMEGSSPSVESKVVSIGTLGLLLQRDAEMTPLIYPARLAWMASDE